MQLGDYRLELSDEEKLEAAGQPSGQSRPVHMRPDRLVVVVGPTPGQEFPLDREHFTVGRAEDATISINHSSVSRLHAEIIGLGGGRYEIIDKGSANGIRINGHELKRGILEAGDALELGDVRVRFVGRGKIFRAGFDRSQELAAVKGFDSVSPSIRAPGSRGAAEGSGVGKWIGIGAVLGVIAIGVVFAVIRKGDAGPTNPTPEETAGDEGSALLDQAKELAEIGELEAAHKKLLQIPETSSVRSDPAFREIAGKWADQMFERVEETEDLNQKRLLLHQIASTNTVDVDRRTRAAKKLQEIDPTAPDPMVDPTPLKPMPAYAPRPKPTSVEEDVYGDKKPKDGDKEPETSGKDALSDPKGSMNALIGKMAAGTATREELLMLRGLCIQHGNRACRDQASAALKAMEKK